MAWSTGAAEYTDCIFAKGCNGSQARLENLYEWVEVSLEAQFIRCSTVTKQKLSKLLKPEIDLSESMNIETDKITANISLADMDKKYKMQLRSKTIYASEFGLVWFYGTSTIVGYLMPNPVLFI